MINILGKIWQTCILNSKVTSLGYYQRTSQPRYSISAVAAGHLSPGSNPKDNKSVEGIDISPEQIDAGKVHRVKNVRQQDAFAFLEAKEEVYDLISAHDLIEHFEKGRVLALLELIHKVLKPGGGRVLISTLNAESIFSARHRYYDFTHEVGFTPHSLSQVLYFTGFTDVKLFPKEPCVHGLISEVRWVL